MRRKKVFFFEKKNQKTFVCLVPRKSTQFVTAKEQKFLVLFFKKEHCFFHDIRGLPYGHSP